MNIKLCAWIFLLGLTFAQAQTNSFTAMLQQGLFDEEAGGDLNAAVIDYLSLAKQFDKDRQVAATAIYRLGECYRKLGQTNEAVAQYQRIAREFSDQKTLAVLSQQNLTGLGVAAPQHAADRLAASVGKNPAEATAEPAAMAADAELEALKAQIATVENLDREKQRIVVQQTYPNPVLTILMQQLSDAQQRFAVATNDYVLTNNSVLKITSEMSTINQQIDDQIDGVLGGLRVKYQMARDRADLLHKQLSQAQTSQSATALAADEEEKEIQRIQQMIKDSPDLINSPGSTELNRAASSGELRVAAFLLDHGADVNSKPNGEPPLNRAANSAQKTMAELLLNRGADVNARDRLGGTALLTATRSGYQAVVEMLLAHKADVNAPYAKSFNEETPLHLAAENGYVNLVKLFLAAGANPNAEDSQGQSPLSNAVRRGSREIIQALLAAGAAVNTQTAVGRTPLSYAAGMGDPQIVKLLLAGKADPNGGKLDAPLLCAVHKQDAGSAELLLQAGASPDSAGAMDLPVDDTTYFRERHEHLTPLWLAVYENQFSMVQLLLKYKADPNNSQTDGRSLLFGALSNTNILEALLNAGALVDPVSAEEAPWTPLGAAANRSLDAAVGILLKHGADPNARSPYGVSPLHWAAGPLADGKVFELLLANNADPNVRSSAGKTPLDLVKERLVANDVSPGQKNLAGRLADLLRQHGALDNLPDWDRITVGRPAAGFSTAVFCKGTNDWNQFTLLETILNFYEASQSYSVPQGNNASTMGPAISLLAFPDLTRVVIVRPNRDSTNVTRMFVNLLNPTKAIDCSKDVSLEFGDVVEIPERDHSLGDKPVGLTGGQTDTIANFLKGNAQLLVRDQKVELQFYRLGYQSTVLSVLNQPEAQKLLLSSSDLARVKVSRRDSKTGKRHEWILDCRNPPSPSEGVSAIAYRWQTDGNSLPTSNDLRLRDGDIIEVPEKP